MKEFYSNPGCPYRIIREPKVKDDGSIEVVEVGKEDFQAYIDSFSESCDIRVLVQRATVDPSVLNQRQGFYGDFTQMPKTYAEMLQRMIDAETFFYSLDPDIRSEFDNDPNKFIAKAMDKDVLVKVGLIQPSEKESEVSEP